MIPVPPLFRHAETLHLTVLILLQISTSTTSALQAIFHQRFRRARWETRQLGVREHGPLKRPSMLADTQALLKLSAQTGGKSLHHISSLASTKADAAPALKLRSDDGVQLTLRQGPQLLDIGIDGNHLPKTFALSTSRVWDAPCRTAPKRPCTTLLATLERVCSTLSPSCETSNYIHSLPLFNNLT